ncbi:vegetative incompatibility protein HET-E-1 [Bipolaris maydis]|nr:vegetative incompatibility protein HET-E-1 [Bipolaris maydis]KAJ6284911.1 WD40-repeat-containing domain protein [Bipolaris maydis]
MRLLKRDENGGIIIESFSDGLAPPPYAILSHTWGEDNDEVTFADIVNGNGKGKVGYNKICFCDKQTQRDGLQYFWVDTCCINKDDKAELSQAIQSMFRWYQNAKTCYVYLSDVQTKERKVGETVNGPDWQAMFTSSRWFTRGWTLQELIAPRTVKFFSKEGNELGDRSSLRCLINKITSIPLQVLDGGAVSQFKSDERQRWANDRNTKLKEDKAYALSGLCGVHIAPVYGEGEEEAFRRLHSEIEKLEACVRHLRDSDPRNDKKRIEETKGGLLFNSYDWILDHSTFHQWQHDPTTHLLWVKGDPGKGKTMLLCGIIDEIQKNITYNTVAYFFCQATDSRINNAVAVLRGLLYMLIDQQPLLAQHVQKQHEHAGKHLFEDANAWIALRDIFRDVLQDPNLGRTCFIVDALDECIVDLPKLLDFVAKQSSESDRVKWIVSSRNWPDIEAQLEGVGNKIKLSLELNADSIATAVGAFIEQKVNILATKKQYTRGLQLEVLQHLTSNANDTFLWVALVCQNLEKTPTRHVRKKLNQFPPGLDALYERMVSQISGLEDAEACLQVLALAAVSYRPITIPELVTLAEQVQENTDDVEEIVAFCGSFLTLREGILYFVHQSAKDFLLTKAALQIFPDGAEAIHYLTFLRSMEVMSSRLHRDIYNLQEQGIANKDINIPVQDPLAPVRYSCAYWADHLRDSNSDWSNDNAERPKLIATIESFFKETFLYWIEALSLCRNVEQGIAAVAKVLLVMQNVEKGIELDSLMNDAWRFIMHHKNMIKKWPLQIYTSGILFSPRTSIIRDVFESQSQGWNVRPYLEHSWGACLQTLEGHSRWTFSVAFSPDGTRLASASFDFIVKIWDANSGQCLQNLEGHSDGVKSVAFSPDGTMLASASYDTKIKIWDAHSGQCLRNLDGHFSFVFSVAFSPDGTMLASASYDTKIKIWDAYSGQCLQNLKGHRYGVNSVAYSPDGTRLASASEDQTVKIWDADSGQCLQTLKEHSSPVRFVAFSPKNTTRLASASEDQTVKIWDEYSGQCLHTLKGHQDYVNSVAFSPHGTELVSASNDRTVKIWDMDSRMCLYTLDGFGDSVSSVVFSPNGMRLASASNKHVKIWDARIGFYLHKPERHSKEVGSIAFSADGTRLVSVSSEVKIWDAYSGRCMQTLEGQNHKVSPVTLLPDGAYPILGQGKIFPHASIVGAASNIINLGYVRKIGRNIRLDNDWISLRGKRILWIPEEYRAHRSTIRNNKIAIGTKHGRVWICTFHGSVETS